MKKLTNTGFIRKAMQVWGDKYDFKKTAYLNMRTKVIVTCYLHGDFETRPGNFIYNRTGCPACGGQFGSNKAEFIFKSKQIHGDTYDYSLVEYVSAIKEVKITCKTHGVFLQKPTVHLIGCGCQKCGKVAHMTTESFINRAKSIHGDKYDYDVTEFKNSTEKVKISCPTHGLFEQIPHNHLRGSGCPMCGDVDRKSTKRLSESEAAVRCSEKGITLLKYAGNAMGKSLLKCSSGHVWETSLSKIQQGSSCPVCTKPGYNPMRRGYVYVLKSECGQFMKIGLSNKPLARMKVLLNATPFGFSRLVMKQLPGFDAPKEETRLHKIFISANLTGFDGCTEWFLYDDEILNEF
nr:MAG TPA: restriction enzyme [Caudoviricetes sp.]